MVEWKVNGTGLSLAAMRVAVWDTSLEFSKVE